MITFRTAEVLVPATNTNNAKEAIIQYFRVKLVLLDGLREAAKSSFFSGRTFCGFPIWIITKKT